MKLQVAIDLASTAEALALMEQIHPYVDIVEMGSPLVLCEGFHAVKAMKEAHPDKLILADAKIVDAGELIGGYAYDAGADIVTTIGLTNDGTCKGLVSAARARGKFALADTIGVENLMERIRELDEMGFDYILMHTAHDMLEVTGSAPIEHIRKAKEVVKHAKIGVSGGITLEQMPEIISANPDWIVVGGSIYNAEDPAAAAKAFRSYME